MGMTTHSLALWSYSKIQGTSALRKYRYFELFAKLKVLVVFLTFDYLHCLPIVLSVLSFAAFVAKKEQTFHETDEVTG